MAERYDVDSTENVTVVLSSNSVMEMTRFGITTKPGGGTAYLNVPVKDTTAPVARVSLERLALLIETALELDGVVAARAEQDVDNNGLLADFVVFLVELDPADPNLPGPYSREVRVLTRNLTSDLAFGQYVATPIAAALAWLRAVVEG